MIKIYSTPTCSWCQKVKRYLKSNNLKYTDINVNDDMAAADEMRKISGQDGVPVVVINGKIIIGFDKAAIDEAIGLNKE
jgi:glutaredoxin 3